MPRHFLKIWPEHFQPVHDGMKLAELRKDDRFPPYARHDELVLQEWDPHPDPEQGGLTFREVLVRVSHASRGSHIPEGLVLLSIRKEDCSCCKSLPGHEPGCKGKPCPGFPHCPVGGFSKSLFGNEVKQTDPVAWHDSPHDQEPSA